MKKIINLFAIFILVICVLSSIFLPVIATAPALDLSKPNIQIISPKTIKQGEVAEFKIVLDKNPGFYSIKLNVSYDKSAFEPVLIGSAPVKPNSANYDEGEKDLEYLADLDEYFDLLEKYNVSYANISDVFASTCVFTNSPYTNKNLTFLIESLDLNNVIKNGEIISFKLRAKSSAGLGEKTLSFAEYDESDFFNYDLENVEFTFNEAKIQIVDGSVVDPTQTTVTTTITQTTSSSTQPSISSTTMTSSSTQPSSSSTTMTSSSTQPSSSSTTMTSSSTQPSSSSTTMTSSSTNTSTTGTTTKYVTSTTKPSFTFTDVVINSIKLTSNSKAVIRWKAIKGVNGYVVFKKTENGGFKELAKTRSTSYTDSKLKAGKKYTYKVCVYVEDKVGGFSKSKAITTLNTNRFKVNLKSKKSKQIKVSWKQVKGADGYVVMRSLKSNKSFKKVKTIKKAKIVLYTNTKLKSKTKYFYKVRAYKKIDSKNIFGAWSKVVSTRAK